MVEKYFRPLWVRTHELLEAGIVAGELIAVDPEQIRYSALGANVFYFLTAPLTQLAFGFDPLERRELEHRRRATVEYLGQAIFTDREHGARVAARVLAATPMPKSIELKKLKARRNERTK
jgi:TetR/AcrR family transcriptional regulator